MERGTNIAYRLMLTVSLAFHHRTMHVGNHSMGSDNTAVGVYRKFGLEANP